MKLKMQEMRLFDLVFESVAGWLLDFSNRTLSDFFDEELNIDIDDERYQEEGTSKAKRVRCLLKQVDRETALRVLSALWQYKMEFMLSRPNKAIRTILHSFPVWKTLTPIQPKVPGLLRYGTVLTGLH